MTTEQQILSEYIIYDKYAKYLDTQQRRESWEELVERNKAMHLKKFPELKVLIDTAYERVLNKEILPSMRSLQFAGKAIEVNNSRINNCSYAPIDDTKVFSEIMFLLLGGVGVGFSVQNNHIDKLPPIHERKGKEIYKVEDSIEGWADAIDKLINSYLKPEGKNVIFDLRGIRPKGARLVTAGGKAPGPEPLNDCLININNLFKSIPVGEKLRAIDVHDIVCFIADAVMAGGIRRAALLSLFNYDDKEMLNAKTGEWWIDNPQRGRANNSVALDRNRVTKELFHEIWDIVKNSGAGEPGIYFTNDPNMGTNPCFTGDTPLLTADGYKPIGELVDTEFDIINKDGEIHKGKVWSNGIKDIVEIKSTITPPIRSTPDHVFMLNNGEECQAKDLQGKRLMPFIKTNNIIDEYVKYGFIQGDGTLSRLNSPSHLGLEVNIGKDDKDIAVIFKVDYSPEVRSYYLTEYTEKLKNLGFSKETLPNRRFPSTFNKWTSQQKLSFLKGLYSANGSVIKKYRVSYKTTSKGLVEDLSEVLNHFGIENYTTINKSTKVKFYNGEYTCKESYDVNITQYNSILKFAELINFVQVYKREFLNDLLRLRSPMITSVKAVGTEEVFDFNIDDNTHWGVVNGVIAHNCAEIALNPFTFCNLVDINASIVESQEHFQVLVANAALLATLQAGYTDFNYLRPIWKENTEKDALIGIGITGIASNKLKDIDLSVGAKIAKSINHITAKKIGINPAARATTIKPSGSSSLVLGTSSGIHSYHNDYYVRGIQVDKAQDVWKYLKETIPELVEDYKMIPNTGFLKIPIKAPEGAITRQETTLDLLERVKRFNVEWVKEGHRTGANTNNVSATISIKDNEWDMVRDWMWDNRDTFNGLSVLPYDGGTYIQAPFTNSNKEEYETLREYLKDIDLTQIKETEDNTDLTGELACSADGCIII